MTTISSASRIPPVVSSGVSIASSRTRRSRSASNSSSIEMSDRRRRKSPEGVALSRSTERWRATSGWSTTVTPVMAGDAIASSPMTEPSRNVELKAHDPDPARTLERALAAGARDEGLLRQRDTYFHVAAGRLKLREEDPGGATLIAYERPDDGGRARVELPAGGGPGRRRAALRAGGRQRDRRRRGQAPPPADVGDGAHPPRRGPRARLVPRARGRRRAGQRPAPRARARSPACASCSRSPTRRCARAPTPTRCAAPAPATARWGSPTRSSSPSPARPPAAPTRPTPNFPVGAAVRTTDGRRYAGANVENAAYPQGQCAEASAIGALVAGGGGEIAEVVVAAPSTRALHAVRRLPPAAARVRARRRADPPRRPRARAPHDVSLGELLPLSFGPEHLAA